MMHIISETAVYVAICAALPVILLIGEIKAERERRRRAEDDRDLLAQAMPRGRRSGECWKGGAVTVGQEITLAVCIVGVVLLTALSITVSYWSKQMGGRR